MKYKFKVGDIVTGKKKNTYSMTNCDMTKGKVIGRRKKEIDVEIVEHLRCPERAGRSFWVEEKYFKPVIQKQDSYDVGDRVLIRKWKDMEKEYGLDSEGRIYISPCVNLSMKQFCGKICTITDVNTFLSTYKIKRCDVFWDWTNEMIAGKVLNAMDLEDKSDDGKEEKDDQPQKLLNTKICVTKSGRAGMTVGKIYEIKDGKFFDNTKGIFPTRAPLVDIEDAQIYFRMVDGERFCGGHYSNVEFIQVVEEQEYKSEELYNGRVICVDTGGSNVYTVGKIYQFVNGKMMGDALQSYPYYPVASFREWEKVTSGKFIEVVE